MNTRHFLFSFLTTFFFLFLTFRIGKFRIPDESLSLIQTDELMEGINPISGFASSTSVIA